MTTTAFGDPVFDALFGALDGSGTWAEPPDIVPLRILRLAAMPASHAEVKAAFRALLPLVHPDVAAYTAAPWLQAAADAQAQARPEVAELVWARDVLLRKIPPPVTANGGSLAPTVTRHGFERDRCKGGCGHTDLHGLWDPGGYCPRCAADRANGRRRDLRLEARADRRCKGCGELFTPPRSDGRYCSPACRQRAYRNRPKGTP